MKTETDSQLIKSLNQLATDDSLEGSEATKNRFLAPAPAVPKLDREVAEAAGKRIGLEPVLPDKKVEEKLAQQPTESNSNNPKVSSLYRSVSQDEMMGYDDDEY